MLWIKVKVGESVYIDNSVLTLITKDRSSITVALDEKQYRIRRNERTEFPTFVLCPGSLKRGLRLGFDAPQSVRIRREKLEAQLPTE